MVIERMNEFILMLNIERLASKNKDFYKYLEKYYDLDKFNDRYKELLDEFLNDYALNNTEKSD